MGFYDDPKYGVEQVLPMKSLANQTSVIASQTEIARHTFMKAVTVTDWNVRVLVGHTETSGFTAISINKSLAGTGALSAFGTASLSTNADKSVIDDAVTANQNFAAGDDIVLAYDAGTALPAGAFRVDADVLYKQRFTQ